MIPYTVLPIFPISGLLRPDGRAGEPAALHVRHGARQPAHQAAQEHDLRGGSQVQAQDAEGDGPVMCCAQARNVVDRHRPIP